MTRLNPGAAQPRGSPPRSRVIRTFAFVLAASLSPSCHGGTPVSSLPAGPLAYRGFPNRWTGAVAQGQPRAWALIRFGEQGVTARIDAIRLADPLPPGIDARFLVNSGRLVPTGATDDAPLGARLESIPVSVSKPVQVVVWFDAAEPGINYQTDSTIIDYAIGNQTYEAVYPVGVGICTVTKVTDPCLE
jgi:hypothetical protein